MQDLDIKDLLTMSPVALVIYFLYRFGFPLAETLVKNITSTTVTNSKNKAKHWEQKFLSLNENINEKIEFFEERISILENDLSELKTINTELGKALEKVTKVNYELKLENEGLNLQLAIFEETLTSMEDLYEAKTGEPMKQKVTDILKTLKHEVKHETEQSDE